MSTDAPPAGLPPRAPSLSYPPHEASKWRRIRRYAVPGWMIEWATERRLAGDWRGACAAANVDAGFDSRRAEPAASSQLEALVLAVSANLPVVLGGDPGIGAIGGLGR